MQDVVNIEESKLEYLEEPLLEFAYGQKAEYSKDGLFLYGPFSQNKRQEITFGVIGTTEGIKRFEDWYSKIQSYIEKPSDKTHFYPFMGFEAIFGSKLIKVQSAYIELNKNDIINTIRIENLSEAIYKTVDIYYEKLKNYITEEECQPDFWYVVVPEEVHEYGRPQSKVPKDKKVKSKLHIDKKTLNKNKINQQVSLFQSEEEFYKYKNDFRKQLKARLLENKVVTQFLRETSLTPKAEEFMRGYRPIRGVQDDATRAWNLSTTSFFKASYRPWKLADVRKGVCYVGLVYKKYDVNVAEGNACCGAQIFLDSGDGLVFKGAVGDWYDKKTKEYHLSKEIAAKLMTGLTQLAQKHLD